MKYSFSDIEVKLHNGIPVARFSMADENHQDATLAVAKQLAPLELLRPFVDRVVTEDKLFVPGMKYRLGIDSEIVMMATPGTQDKHEIILMFDALSDRTPESAGVNAMRGIAEIMHERGLVDDEGRAQFLRAVDEGCRPSISDTPPKSQAR